MLELRLGFNIREFTIRESTITSIEVYTGLQSYD